jgi:Fur family ferric uptake transcriptional regulator
MGGSRARNEHEQARRRLAEYLARRGLKQTKQREAILSAFLEAGGHMTSEDLYERVRARYPEIGAATVYRTLKLLAEAGIANPSHFRAGVTLYEHRAGHHDHLICMGCAEIIEFECTEIETAQVEVAERYGYRLTNHRHDLYGYCHQCKNQGDENS